MKYFYQSLFFLALIVQLIVPSNVFAQQAGANDILAGIGTTEVATGSEQDFLKILNSIITTLLSIMGILLLGTIIYSGFEYMTSGGENEKNESAVNRIRNATIGLLIVMISYALTSFIINLVENASSGPTS